MSQTQAVDHPQAWDPAHRGSLSKAEIFWGHMVSQKGGGQGRGGPRHILPGPSEGTYSGQAPGVLDCD